MKRDIIFLDEACLFLANLDEKARDKVLYNIHKVSRGIESKDLFKKLIGTNIWEFRTLYNGNAYRLLAFWDRQQQTLIVATHGFNKKTQKTPRTEIERAEKIRDAYYKNN